MAAFMFNIGKKKESEMIRAKFILTEITQFNWNKQSQRVKLVPQYDTTIPEDRRFALATPSGELWMQIDNPSAAAALKLGEAYYIDISPVAMPTEGETR